MNVQTFITCVASACAIVFGYIAFLKSAKKESQDTGQERGRFNADVEYIKRRVDEVLLDVKGISATLTEHERRITEAIDSAKSAHHRIDELIASKGK